MRRGDHLWRGLERAEGFLTNRRGNIASNRTAWVGFIDTDQATGILDTLDHRVGIDRRKCAQVDDFTLDALLGQYCCSFAGTGCSGARC